MDSSLFTTSQGQHVAAAHAVGTSLLPKGGTRSTPASAAGLAGKPTANAAAAGTSGTSGTSGASSTTASNATITSNDFLTLLVSELKNQDPTQPTDPNAYITQLVGVNSLEQLIQINSGIGALTPPKSTTPTPHVAGATGTFAPATPGSLAGVSLQHAKGPAGPGLA